MALLTLRNNLNRFWDFYYGTKVGAGSLKVIFNLMELPYPKVSFVIK
jgi:hypothetical protein